MPPKSARTSAGQAASRKRHDARHPAGAEEDWELSSEDELAAGAIGGASAGAPLRRRGAAAMGRTGGQGGLGASSEERRRSMADLEGYPTFNEDLPALMDLSLWRQGVLATRTAATLTLMLLLAYSFVLAPLGLPSWVDEARLLFTWGYKNAVCFAMMAAATLHPLLIMPLMLPAMRSANTVPLWPFLLASPLLGSYALLAYFSVFKCPRKAARLPPSMAELRRGAGGLVMRVTEGRALPACLLAVVASLAAVALSANQATWDEFYTLFNTSRMVHCVAIDIALMAIIGAMAARRDARLRGAPIASATAVATLPLVGPALYLLARPAARRASARPRVRRGRKAAGMAADEGFPLPPERHAPGGPQRGVLGALRALLIGVPSGVAVFLLSILVVLMPSRVGLRRQLSGAKRRVRRVASFVFQGTHIERSRVPVRQFSVSSDHGVQEHTDPDHPNALAAATLDAAAQLQEQEEERERREAEGRYGHGYGYGYGDSERAAADELVEEEEEEDGDEEEEEEEEEDGDEEVMTEDGTEEQEEEEEEAGEIKAEVVAARRGALKDYSNANAEAPPTPAQQARLAGRAGGAGSAVVAGAAAVIEREDDDDDDDVARGRRDGRNGLLAGSPASSGVQRSARAAKQAALAAIHQLAATEHPRAAV